VFVVKIVVKLQKIIKIYGWFAKIVYLVQSTMYLINANLHANCMTDIQ